MVANEKFQVTCKSNKSIAVIKKIWIRKKAHKVVIYYRLMEVLCLPHSKETRAKHSRIATPSSGIDGINHAIRALYAFKRPAGYKELAKPAGISDVYMSMSLSASRHVGLTKLAGQRGVYELTEWGEKYAMFLTAGKDQQCRDVLEQVILQNPWWTEIINFLKINQGKERDIVDLVLDIERKLGKKWSNQMRARISSSLGSILGYSELVKVNGNKIIPKFGWAESNEDQEEEKEKNMKDEMHYTQKLEKVPDEFAEFRIPDSFILYVRKDKNAMDFFEKQVNSNSVFIPWLELIRKKMDEKTIRKS